MLGHWSPWPIKQKAFPLGAGVIHGVGGLLVLFAKRDDVGALEVAVLNLIWLLHLQRSNSRIYQHSMHIVCGLDDNPTVLVCGSSHSDL